MTDDISEWLGELPELRRVVPVVQEVYNDDGSRTVLASVEIWNTMLAIQSTTVSPDRRRLNDLAKSRRMWGCSDDVGTTYAFSGGGGSGAERYWTEHWDFNPAPPAEAKHLVLSPPHAPGKSITVEL